MSDGLRPMTGNDVEAVVAVQHAGAVAGLSEVFDQASHPFDDERIAARWRTELATPGIAAWVASDDRGVAGFAAVRDDELLHLGTRPDTWGSGLATRLHDAVLAEAAALGRPVVRLWVFAANPRARRFYARLGWREDGSRSRSGVPPYPLLVGLRRSPAVPRPAKDPVMSTAGTVRTLARVALGGALAFAGTSHLTFAREEFRAQVPNAVVKLGPLSTDQVVLASGVVEIALGAAIAFAPERRREAVGNVAAAFFTAVFPGNLAQLANHRDAFGLDTDAKRALRLLGQPVLVAWALWSTRTGQD